VNKCPTWCNEELCLGGPQAQEGELIDGVEVPDHRPRLVGDALHQAGHLRRCRVVKAALGDSALHTHGNNEMVKYWSSIIPCRQWQWHQSLLCGSAAALKSPPTPQRSDLIVWNFFRMCMMNSTYDLTKPVAPPSYSILFDQKIFKRSCWRERRSFPSSNAWVLTVPPCVSFSQGVPQLEVGSGVGPKWCPTNVATSTKPTCNPHNFTLSQYPSTRSKTNSHFSTLLLE